MCDSLQGLLAPWRTCICCKDYVTLYFKALFNHMIRFHLTYFLLTLLLLGVEIFIGACMHDAVIRPYGGDLLVVVLLYCAVRSFWELPVAPLSLSILVFSYLVETGQYFHLA